MRSMLVEPVSVDVTTWQHLHTLPQKATGLLQPVFLVHAMDVFVHGAYAGVHAPKLVT